MRRRVKAARGPINVMSPAPIPTFVDDLSLPNRERIARYDAWMQTHFEPWAKAKAAFEDANGVIIVDAADRHFYSNSQGVMFVEGVPRAPDAPFDWDAL